jgi:hypothetical protein
MVIALCGEDQKSGVGIGKADDWDREVGKTVKATESRDWMGIKKVPVHLFVVRQRSIIASGGHAQCLVDSQKHRFQIYQRGAAT